MSLGEGLLAVAGMTALVLLSRGFFFLSRREVPFPPWLRRSLRYAPLAALAAVAAPEIVITRGALTGTLQDARIAAALAGAAWYFWRRDILGTIACGLATLLALRLGLGW